VKVRFTLRARNDLESILDDLAKRSRYDGVAAAIRKSVDLIGSFPERGRNVDQAGVRVIPVGRFPYLIFWSLGRNEVRILHVRHARREPWPGA
jgi:toxin ParE1/3/4